eukprot:scaffold219717_cov31-Tisochrysis_lutea.AAC.4
MEPCTAPSTLAPTTALNRSLISSHSSTPKHEICHQLLSHSIATMTAVAWQPPYRQLQSQPLPPIHSRAEYLLSEIRTAVTLLVELLGLGAQASRRLGRLVSA